MNKVKINNVLRIIKKIYFKLYLINNKNEYKCYKNDILYNEMYLPKTY